jgi:hypothetical protein
MGVIQNKRLEKGQVSYSRALNLFKFREHLKLQEGIGVPGSWQVMGRMTGRKLWETKICK